MYNSFLVGCIQILNKVIRTRYFYVSKETNEARDVTLELCNAIDDYNEHAKKIRDTGEYAMIIPYDYKNGMAEYSFGCGLSHYLQQDEFENIVERSHKELSFPLTKCLISMYTPNDVKHILSCKGVFDINIVQSLKERYGLKEMDLITKETRVCKRCGTQVEEEKEIEEYPYYCPSCDENMYEFETEVKKAE